MVWEKAVSKQQTQLSEKEHELEMIRGAGMAGGADLSKRNAPAAMNQEQQFQLQNLAMTHQANAVDSATSLGVDSGSIIVAGSGGKANASPTLEELGEARHMVDNLRRLVDAQRRTLRIAFSRATSDLDQESELTMKPVLNS